MTRSLRSTVSESVAWKRRLRSGLSASGVSATKDPRSRPSPLRWRRRSGVAAAPEGRCGPAAAQALQSRRQSARRSARAPMRTVAGPGEGRGSARIGTRPRRDRPGKYFEDCGRFQGAAAAERFLQPDCRAVSRPNLGGIGRVRPRSGPSEQAALGWRNPRAGGAERSCGGRRANRGAAAGRAAFTVSFYRIQRADRTAGRVGGRTAGSWDIIQHPGSYGTAACCGVRERASRLRMGWEWRARASAQQTGPRPAQR